MSDKTKMQFTVTADKSVIKRFRHFCTEEEKKIASTFEAAMTEFLDKAEDARVQVITRKLATSILPHSTNMVNR
mgnify:CR=1 FL=1